eukprot:COSAG04_NODE_19765_length_408_cov_1.886731_1_plen_54_part_10
MLALRSDHQERSGRGGAMLAALLLLALQAKTQEEFKGGRNHGRNFRRAALCSCG